MSRSKRRGRDQPAKALRARATSPSLRATSGNTPSSAKEISSDGDAMSDNDSTCASCVPAFTYTRVPGSMPTCDTA